MRDNSVDDGLDHAGKKHGQAWAMRVHVATIGSNLMSMGRG